MRRIYFYAKALTVILLTLPLTAGAISDPVTVCILDSGCNLPDIQGRNYLDGTQDLTDPEGHGTYVYELLKETAPEAELYMLKCFDSSTAIIQAVYDAVDVYDADIINMSWTLNQDSE